MTSLVPNRIFGDEPLRPSKPTELAQKGLTVEAGIPVEGARVAWVNYSLVRRDFPQIRKLSNQEIDAWLIHNFAYIGSRQHELIGVRNTSYSIDASRPTKSIYRQKGWIRSGTLEALGPNGEVVGMVDVKGLGLGLQSGGHMNMTIEQQIEEMNRANQIADRGAIDSLRTKPYTNGMMSLGEGVAEITRQQAVQRALEFRGVALETVESYALITWPIGMLKTNNESIPTGIYLRQAHLDGGASLPAPSSIYRDPEGNLQHTASHSIKDMGGVIVTDPLVSENFQSDGRAQASRPWAWGHQVADAFLRGDLDAVYRHIREMLGETLSGIESPSPAREALRLKRTSMAKSLFARNARPAEILKELPIPISVLSLSARDKDPYIRSKTYSLLQGRSEPEALEILRRAAKDADIYARKAAAEALSWGPGIDSAEILKTFFLDPEKEVRAGAYRGLFERNHTEILLLTEFALERVSDIEILRSCINQLKGKNDEKSYQLLERALHSADRTVRWYAAYAASSLKPEFALPLLKIATSDRDAEIKEMAVEYLEKLPAQIKSCSLLFKL